MASLIEDLVSYIGGTTLITGATSNRIHAYHVPQHSRTPHVLINRDGRDSPLTLDGVAGLFRTDFSIEIATTAPGACEDLIDAVFDRLHGVRGTVGASTVLGIFVNDVDSDYQFSNAFDDAGLCLAAKRISVWHTT